MTKTKINEQEKLDIKLIMREGLYVINQVTLLVVLFILLPYWQWDFLVRIVSKIFG